MSEIDKLFLSHTPYTKHFKQAKQLTIRYWSQGGTNHTELKPQWLEFYKGVVWTLDYLHNHTDGIDAT